MSTLQQLSTRNVDPNLSLYENVAKDAALFCDNLNCLRSFCKTHGMLYIIRHSVNLSSI